MNLNFRKLKADEIDVRVGTVGKNNNYITLLLYKNARVDMDILDETVGKTSWQREHKELKGNIYAGVSIYNEDFNQWVTKWDAGKESNTEAEKGEASDSFKRACVNWGIGRELYTSPQIFLFGKADELKKDRYSVKSIEYEDNNIKSLSIIDSKGNIVYEFPKNKTSVKSTVTSLATKEQVDKINELLLLRGIFDDKRQALFNKLKINKVEELTTEKAQSLIKQLEGNVK